jgi:hypothetical protein
MWNTRIADRICVPAEVPVVVPCSHEVWRIIRTQGPHLPACTIEHLCRGCGQVWRTGFEGHDSLPPGSGTRLSRCSPIGRWRGYA